MRTPVNIFELISAQVVPFVVLLLAPLIAHPSLMCPLTKVLADNRKNRKKKENICHIFLFPSGFAPKLFTI
jgi:hypothetical protein